MRDITLTRGQLREIDEVQPALKAVLGDNYMGMSLRGQEAIIHLTDSADSAVQRLAETTYNQALAVIDPQKPTPSEVRALKHAAAQRAVATLDYGALKQRVAAANSVSTLRSEVEILARLAWQLAAAQGLTEQDDPGGN